MKCLKCGAELVDNAKFCRRCGEAVQAAPEEAAKEIVKEQEPAQAVEGRVVGGTNNAAGMDINMILAIVSIALPIIGSCFCGMVAPIGGIICGAISYFNGRNKLGLVGMAINIFILFICFILFVLSWIGSSY